MIMEWMNLDSACSPSGWKMYYFVAESIILEIEIWDPVLTDLQGKVKYVEIGTRPIGEECFPVYDLPNGSYKAVTLYLSTSQELGLAAGFI